MSKTVIRNWNLLNNTLSPNTFDFCRKALNFSLNSTRNLGRWNNRDPPNCDLWVKPHTQIHFLNNRTSAINNGRFKWRHDLIRLTRTNEYDVFADVEGYRSSAALFNSSIPDTVAIKGNILYTIELTVCFETNFSKSRNYRLNRYKNLSNEVVGNYPTKKMFLEISSLGFYANDTKPFIKPLKELKIHNTERMLRKCSELATKTSFYFQSYWRVCLSATWCSIYYL